MYIGTSGQAKNFITRTQAVRKLQISLPDFRRLCIFKGISYSGRIYQKSFALIWLPGIYPREPRNKKKASKSSTPSTTFYYTRDIQYLLHEPLLQKFRDQKALAKKIARSLGRGEVSDAARLEKNNAPKITLDHIVKERYPTFIDALRDLDDALCLLFLFANLPSTFTVPPKVIAQCQRLCQEFQHYLITTHSLRKSFLSIKGIYYQATVKGQDIMWLVPYRFVQRAADEVDYRIMATFVQFYTTLLGFVNFRLYTSIGLVYPPKFDSKRDDEGAELAAFTLESRKVIDDRALTRKIQTNGTEGSDSVSEETQNKVDTVLKKAPKTDESETLEAVPKEESSESIDTFEPVAPEADTLPQPQIEGNQAGSLFSQYTVFISRETPRPPLEFLLRAFGCQRIAWDAVLGDGAFTINELDTRITHQIVDRPALPESSLLSLPQNPTDETEVNPRVRPGHRVPGRIYVQPQWVWDCVNEGRIVRPDLYAPGATLPPHLSPWVKPSKGEYDPRATLEEQEEEDEAERAAEEDEMNDDKESGNELEEHEVEDAEPTKFITGKEQSKKQEQEKEDTEDNPKSDDESLDGGMNVELAGSDNDEESEDDDDEFSGFDDDENAESESENEEEAAQSQHQRELEAEAAGISFSSATDSSLNGTRISKKHTTLTKKHADKKRKEEEEQERRKMMMSRKKRKLLDKMLYSNKKREEEAEKLRSKRRKIEQGLKKT